MSRYRLLTIIVVLLVFLEGCTQAETSTPAEASKDKVLLILQEQSEDMEFMLKNEVGVMVNNLEKAGFDVVFASPSGKPVVGGATTLTPDLKLADVKVDDYLGLILPCMAVDLELRRDPDAIRVVKEAAAIGKPIAAQLGGILTLSDAGILDGKQFAMLSEASSLVPNGIYKGEGVVQDGNIITSGICPLMAKMGEGKDGTLELTQKFIDALKSTS
jgi:protease I